MSPAKPGAAPRPGPRDAVFLAVGTGIGAGIISGGRILHGHEDIAGAVGWFGLDPDFKPEYAAMGSFEAEASGNSVARKAARAAGEGKAVVHARPGRGRHRGRHGRDRRGGGPGPATRWPSRSSPTP